MADRSCGVIRRIDTTGQVTTFTGSAREYRRSNQHRDGPATQALFRSLGGMALDPLHGDLYVIDGGGICIERDHDSHALGWLRRMGRAEPSMQPSSRPSALRWRILIPCLALGLAGCSSGSSGSSGTAPKLTSASTIRFHEGTAGSFTVTASGSPASTFSESGALPSGVNFSTSTGVLAGTPATGSYGSYALSLTATNGVSPDAAQTFTLLISQAIGTIREYAMPTSSYDALGDQPWGTCAGPDGNVWFMERMARKIGVIAP
ncbi:MAG: putative Ig domain-containing protein [Holophaga sp.]|nr:putative Ig domain-containing protein [Holophaga sp.]